MTPAAHHRSKASAIADGWSPEHFDPHDPGFLADPYPTYARFREHAPIHSVKPYESHWIFRYADCEQVLSATDTWVKTAPPGSPPAIGPYEMMASFPADLFGSDPPLHTQLRSILEPLFDESIQSAAALAAEQAEPLLAAARQHGSIELVSDYALPVPAHVLFTILGIPNDEGVWSGLLAWQAAITAAHDITQSSAVRGAGATCSMALSAFFEGMRLKSRATPADGFFPRICDAFASAGLSDQEAQMCAGDFVMGGFLSTTFLIGTGVRSLLLNPQQLASLRKDPTLMAGALEEMLRFDAPLQMIDRYAASDTEVGGQRLKQGSKVTAVVGSADRDDHVFADAESFQIERSGKAHLGFGAGIHQCIGAPLARLVAPVAINMLLAELPALELDGLAQWQTDPYLRAVTNLPLRC
jgi:cytochrome P450